MVNSSDFSPPAATSYDDVFRPENNGVDDEQDDSLRSTREERSSSEVRQELVDGIRTLSFAMEETQKQLAQELSDLDCAVTRLKCISHDRAKSQDVSGLDWKSCTTSTPNKDASCKLSPEQLRLLSAPLSPIPQAEVCCDFPVGSRQIVGQLRASRRQNSDLTAERKPARIKISRSRALRTSRSSPAISHSSSGSGCYNFDSDGEDAVDGLIEMTNPDHLDFRLWLSMQTHTWC